MKSALNPMIDTLPAAQTAGGNPEDRHIERLFSANPFARSISSEWLKRNGDSITASKIERILREGARQPKEVKQAAGHVLIDLSFKHLDFAKSTQDRVNRMVALASTLRLTK